MRSLLNRCKTSRHFNLAFFSLVLVLGICCAVLGGCSFFNYSTGAKNSLNSLGTGAVDSDVSSSTNWNIRSSLKNFSSDGESYAMEAVMPAGAGIYDGGYWNTEEYSAVKENGFKKVVTDPVTTFSADVDTASYGNLRRIIEDGYYTSIPDGAVRIEEMLNYFKYDYVDPEDGNRFGVVSEIAQTPWNEDTMLLRIGVKADESMAKNVIGSNLVFLIDVSGSMYDSDKLPLLKQGLIMLLDHLTENDRISIVTYASGEQKLAEGLNPVTDKRKIVRILDKLEANGSTNGQSGLRMAYDVAEDNFIEGGNNRIILCSDGDLNVGMTDESSLSEYVQKKADTGVYLTVLGFGTGNYSDSRMETIADDGNGNYYYIDSILEAQKVLCEELTQTLFTVADDVKFQIEFNPSKVAEYRQIGYENRALENQDFEDDTKDAGEVGAGQTVTVLYELKLADGSEENKLRYQDTTLSDAGNSDEWLSLKIRYKDPGADTSVEESCFVFDSDVTENPSNDFKFASAVAEFGMLVKDSEYKGTSTYASLMDLLKKVDNMDVYKQEFVDLVDTWYNSETENIRSYEDDFVDEYEYDVFLTDD